MKITEEEYGEFVINYLCELKTLITTHLMHWVEDLGISNNKTDMFEYIISDNFIENYKEFDVGIFKHIINNHIYDYIFTLEECLVCAIRSLPCKTDVKQFIKNYINNLYFDHSPDSFDYIEDELTKKLEAILKIQKHWRKCINDPRYLLCRKRLNNEFQVLNKLL